MQIKRGDHWPYWLAVGEGLLTGRHLAMRRAGTNVPVGSAYSKAFGLWLDAHQWARDLDKATRNHAMWAADHRDAIERWRETLAENVRARINHPTTMKRAYEAAHQDAKAEKPASDTSTQNLEREIERLAGEFAVWRKRIETQGSLFDLKQDKVEDVAHAIAGNVSFERLTSLQEALAVEIARLKTEREQAG